MKLLNQKTQEGINALLKYTLKPDGVVGNLTQSAMIVTCEKFKEIFKLKNYIWDDNYNLGSIRMDDNYDNKFGDWGFLSVGKLVYLFPMSTKPGWGKVQNPPTIGGVVGVFCLKEGQYKNVYRLQKTGWSGKPYMQQVLPMEGYRDGNKDLMITRSSYVTYGNFGINFHSWLNYIYIWVNNLSEGCQVVQSTILDELLPFFELMAKKGDITYTLLNKTDF